MLIIIAKTTTTTLGWENIHICSYMLNDVSKTFAFGQWIGTSKLHSAGVVFRPVFSLPPDSTDFWKKIRFLLHFL
jgi:hypothetical protein